MAAYKGQLTLYKGIVLIICALVLSVAFYVRSIQSNEEILTGHTMGVSYMVRYVEHDGREHLSLSNDISELLKEINRQMSTWQKDSDISRFNQSVFEGWQAIPEPFLKVVQAAQMISAKTDGRFDITIRPLVSLWGFQDNKERYQTPHPNEIAHMRQKTGWQKLQLQQSPPALKKTQGDLQIDLSAIAKGYGVDAIAELLEARQINDYMVEIGGEIRVSGSNLEGQNWRVAIETPQMGAPTLLRQLSVAQGGIATSGDYRNYYEVDNIRYSHLIDPVSAAPIRHKTVSVTIVAENTMVADGWATAMMILGADAGLKLAEEANIAALFISRDSEAETGYNLQISHKMGRFLKHQE